MSVFFCPAVAALSEAELSEGFSDETSFEAAGFFAATDDALVFTDCDVLALGAVFLAIGLTVAVATFGVALPLAFLSAGFGRGEAVFAAADEAGSGFVAWAPVLDVVFFGVTIFVPF